MKSNDDGTTGPKPCAGGRSLAQDRASPAARCGHACRPHLVALVLVAATALVGCGEGSGFSVLLGGAGTRTGEPDLMLSTEEVGLAAEFGRIAGLALDSAGHIYVADAQAHEVRVFGPTGEHLYTIGRQGAGPGEFSGPCCLSFDPAGRLWVRDGGNARYVLFETGPSMARPTGTVRMSHGDVNRWAPITFDANGMVIDIGYRPPEGTELPRTGRMHLDPRGSVLRTVMVPAAPAESLSLHTIPRATAQDGEWSATFFMYQPYGPLELVAHSPTGDFAVAISGRYSVAWLDENGDTIRIITQPDAIGPVLSEAERERAEQRIQTDIERIGIARGQVPFDVPDEKAPLRSLFFDADGRLWVELSVEGEDDRRAHVYALDGTLAFNAAWPAGIEMRDNAVYGDVALGVWRDELGAEHVVRLRFGPPR